MVVYPLVNEHSNGISPFLIGNTSSIGPFSIAMFVYQRVMVIYHGRIRINSPKRQIQGDGGLMGGHWQPDCHLDA